MKTPQFILRATAGALALVLALSARGQGFPERPIRIVSPFAAGSSTDVIARIIGQKLQENTGQPVIVDTRPGANGTIAVDAVAKSPPDGYTIVLASNGTHGIAVSMFSKLPYDPVRDFDPIMHVGRVSYVLLVSATGPHASLKDLVAAAKANPGKLSISYAASVAQLTGELFKATAAIQMTSVPYKTPVNAFTDVAGGQVDAHFEPLPSGLPMIKAGRLKGLAVTSATRSALSPDIPTIAESGYAGFESGAWIAFFAPAGTPKDRLAKLHAEILRAMQNTEVRERLAQVGMEPATSTPEELRDMVAREIAKWARVYKEANLPQQN
ncbi:MAG: tripartite tricarboxylate transporter substrate binding protein [Rubrivivax sp.]|nr:tripartite tricarboxylate transporter substrate binding protein [Burkholderiales bacterium]MCW5637198.1 tripartite tricarboxylate transporter substrate binding protein [Rubrivivax sp.]